VIKNIAKSVINYRNHKIVFRASGSIFCDYVYAFINDDPKPGLPFYMLNRNEIPKYYDEFIERLGIDKNREIITEKMIAEITKFFKKLYSVQYWGSSLNRIFQDGLRALYEKDDSPTLKDLYDLVSGKIQHREFQEELKRLLRGRTDSILNKLTPFVKNAFVSRILCRKFSSLSLEVLIAPKRLIAFRLPKGELSVIISVLIGSTIIIKLWFSAMSRDKDFPIILAIDKFHFSRVSKPLET